MATQEQLLTALGAAHEAGDQDGAIQIAHLISSGQYDPSPAPTIENKPTGGGSPDQAGGGGGMVDSVLGHLFGNNVGAADAGLSIARNAVAQPVAGFAGMGAAAAKALGLTNREPADIVNGVQSTIAGRPFTQEGQEAMDTLGKATSFIPKGADWAGQKVTDATGSPALGAYTNAGLQGSAMLLGPEAAGMGLRAAGRGVANIPGARALGTFASDLAPGGAGRAANRVINDAAGPGGAPEIQQHLDAQRALDAAGQSGSLASKYGIQPTTAQVANNVGLAQLDRTIRNTPYARPLTDVDANNGAAISDILGSKAGTPESRDSLGRLRDSAAKASYQAATTAPEHQGVIPPGQDAASFANELAAKNGIGQDGFPSSNDPAASPEGLNDAGVRLQSLLQRPAMQDAMANAGRQAANRGVSMDSSNLIQQLHYAKIHLDGKISAAMKSGDSTELGGLMDTKNELGSVMDKLSPTYAAAKEQFQQLSQPINRADVAEALRQRYQSALTDAGGTGTKPSMFADALRQPNADAFAARATGFPGARMNKIMSPQDMADYQVAVEQMARQQKAQTLGRGAGSNTGQNVVNQRTLDSIASPKMIDDAVGPSGSTAMAILHPGIALGAALRGNSVRAAAIPKIADMMANPELAAAALKRKYNVPNGPTNPVAPYVPGAALSAAANQPQMADGGSVGGNYKKSGFWDLVGQAIKEVTGESSAPAAAPDPGSTASGSVGHDFDSRVDQAVQANGG